ncbi:addiction module antitoxin [Candidatus Enterococcus murrayae]|uniref:Addiction module antitoxin n=1 Tax=Candidatus Enterococcus murrayae TaxID=2815321 RepID=A0ABS3HI18_9ENTE|nr:addiction module antitoxin [Enterococcus sp. MJM16]MBO0452642.1 addiction module antitoxin [Enterococcus sp. MJM16]
MDSKKRKLRLVGNSVMISVSKDFLAKNNLTIGETVFLDEDKLKEAITKINTHDDSKIDFLMNQSIQEHHETYKDLVDL